MVLLIVVIWEVSVIQVLTLVKGNNDAVLPNDYCLTAGSDVADDDVTVG